MNVFEQDIGSVWACIPLEKMHYATNYYDADRLSCRDVLMVDENGNVECLMFTYSHWGCCYNPITLEV